MMNGIVDLPSNLNLEWKWDKCTTKDDSIASFPGSKGEVNCRRRLFLFTTELDNEHIDFDKGWVATVDLLLLEARTYNILYLDAVQS
jgi:hypothetical protein